MGTSAYTVKSTVGVERDRLDRYICLDMSTVGVGGGQVGRVHSQFQFQKSLTRISTCFVS